MQRFNAYGSDFKRLLTVPTFSAKDVRDAGALLRINGHAPCYVVQLREDGKEERGRMSEQGGPAEWYVLGRRVWANGDVGGTSVAMRRAEFLGPNEAPEPVRTAFPDAVQTVLASTATPPTDSPGGLVHYVYHAKPDIGVVPCVNKRDATLRVTTNAALVECPKCLELIRRVSEVEAWNRRTDGKPRANRPGHVRKIKDERNEAVRLRDEYWRERGLCRDSLSGLAREAQVVADDLNAGRTVGKEQLSYLFAELRRAGETLAKVRA